MERREELSGGDETRVWIVGRRKSYGVDAVALAESKCHQAALHVDGADGRSVGGFFTRMVGQRLCQDGRTQRTLDDHRPWGTKHRLHMQIICKS